MGSQGLAAQWLDAGELFERGKGLFYLNVSVRFQRLYDLEKIYNQLFATQAATALADKTPPIQYFRYFRTAGRCQGYRHHIRILTVAESDRR